MFSANGTRRVVHYKAEPSVRDIMMSSPISLQRDNKLSLAEDVMAGGRIRHVPIGLPADSPGRTASRACHQERYVALSRGAERRRGPDRG